MMDTGPYNIWYGIVRDTKTGRIMPSISYLENTQITLGFQVHYYQQIISSFPEWSLPHHKTVLLWKESKNIDGEQFHQYQQKEQ